MNSRTNTAPLYRKAARLLEKHPGKWAACGAIRVVIGEARVRVEAPNEPEVRAFSAFFAPDPKFPNGFWFGDCEAGKANDERIMALCFMAAMVEAGDA